jgi:hypothetical protein
LETALNPSPHNATGIKSYLRNPNRYAAYREVTEGDMTVQLGLQDQQHVATSDLYRDTEGDGYYEKTQWVSATDAQGHVQGLLVLDYNGNGQIETRDILNLGGNAGQEGNLANDATQATANGIRYVFDSYSRIRCKDQRSFLLESANSPVWEICA